MIEFIASLSPLQTAITISGTGDGARVKIDIPQTESDIVDKLRLMQGKAFKVTIEEIDERMGR
jgi:hypothetical protein